jgi:hypothetical protein
LKRHWRRTSPDPESGQAILIRKIRVLNLADILHLRKLSMMLFSALNRTTRLEQFQLAGPLLEKYQNNFLLATQNSSLKLQAESLLFAFAKTGSSERSSKGVPMPNTPADQHSNVD